MFQCLGLRTRTGIDGMSISSTLLFAGLGTILFPFICQREGAGVLGSSSAFLAGYWAIAPAVKRNCFLMRVSEFACSDYYI